ncbi:MAG: hypothetical protein AAF560_15860 [Acidobacteriota bacterium]
MNLPIQSMNAAVMPSAGVTPQGCDLVSGAECAASGAALLAGPCNPLGFPETLPACLPAAAAYVGTCKDCLVAGGKAAICGAMSLAETAGVHVPAVLKSVC